MRKWLWDACDLWRLYCSVCKLVVVRNRGHLNTIAAGSYQNLCLLVDRVHGLAAFGLELGVMQEDAVEAVELEALETLRDGALDPLRREGVPHVVPHAHDLADRIQIWN